MPAHLHHELIAAAGTTPTAWLLLTHGMFGAGSNWRSIARKVVNQRHDWGVVLVDLRHHGKSIGGEPPDTLAACADDVRALIAELAAGGTAIAALAGHSFGGKVVLATRELVAGGGVPPSAVRQTWVLDASPSPRPNADRDSGNTVEVVLGLMERMPPRWPTKAAFVAALIAAGQAKSLADWLAMNLVDAPGGGGELALRLDLPAVRAMLTDYRAQDLWAAVEDPVLPGDVEIVIAERSTSVTAADQGRLAAAPPNVHVHVIADASHWLHIDAPDAVVALFVRELPAL